MDAFTFAWATEEPPPPKPPKIDDPAKRRGIVARWRAYLRKKGKAK